MENLHDIILGRRLSILSNFIDLEKAIPIGTVNKYGKMKMPDGSWQYAKKEDREGHPVAEGIPRTPREHTPHVRISSKQREIEEQAATMKDIHRGLPDILPGGFYKNDKEDMDFTDVITYEAEGEEIYDGEGGYDTDEATKQDMRENAALLMGKLGEGFNVWTHVGEKGMATIEITEKPERIKLRLEKRTEEQKAKVKELISHVSPEVKQEAVKALERATIDSKLYPDLSHTRERLAELIGIEPEDDKFEVKWVQFGGMLDTKVATMFYDNKKIADGLTQNLTRRLMGVPRRLKPVESGQPAPTEKIKVQPGSPIMPAASMTDHAFKAFTNPPEIFEFVGEYLSNIPEEKVNEAVREMGSTIDKHALNEEEEPKARVWLEVLKTYGYSSFFPQFR